MFGQYKVDSVDYCVCGGHEVDSGGTVCDQMYTLYTCVEVSKIKVLHFFQKKRIYFYLLSR